MLHIPVQKAEPYNLVVPIRRLQLFDNFLCAVRAIVIYHDDLIGQLAARKSALSILLLLPLQIKLCCS